jgi:hypothetical protein
MLDYKVVAKANFMMTEAQMIALANLIRALEK